MTTVQELEAAGKVRCDRKEIDFVGSEENFGIADGYGREIGAHAGCFTAVYTARTRDPALPNDGYGWGYAGYWHAPGTVYCYRPSAMRNGQCYGAIQRSQEFATAAERDAAVAKYFAGARKRAVKVAADSAKKVAQRRAKRG